MSNACRVYIGGLDPRTRERDVEKFIDRIGHIREVAMKRGYCFVEFEDQRDADDAVYELNGKTLLGERIVVQHALSVPGRRRFLEGGARPPRWLSRYGPPIRTDYRIIVENLSSRVSWQDLKDFMRKCGEVTYADAHKMYRNEGVVEFSSYDEMKAAVDKLDGSNLNGRVIRLIEDCPKRRKSSSSRSRSKSKDRSRSRSRSVRRSTGRRGGRRSRSRSRSRGDGGRGRSGSKESRSASRSRSRQRSRSAASKDTSRSRSRSPLPKSSRDKRRRSTSPVTLGAVSSSSDRKRRGSGDEREEREKRREEDGDRKRDRDDDRKDGAKKKESSAKNGNSKSNGVDLNNNEASK